MPYDINKETYLALPDVIRAAGVRFPDDSGQWETCMSIRIPVDDALYGGKVMDAILGVLEEGRIFCSDDTSKTSDILGWGMTVERGSDLNQYFSLFLYAKFE